MKDDVIYENCIELMLAGLNTDATKEGYLFRMDYFKKWAKFNTFQEFLELDPKLIQKKVENYILYRRKVNHPNSIGGYYFPIQAFLEMNDVLINFKKMTRLIPSKIKTSVERGWTNEEVKKMLKVCSNPLQHAVIHFENASGGRVGIFNGLLMKHIILIIDEKLITFDKWMLEPNLDLMDACVGIVGYADEKEEYFTYLIPEATQAFFNYVKKRIADGENMTLESPSFRNVYKLGNQPVVASTSKSLAAIVYHIQQRAGLRDPKTKKGKRYAVPTNHGFRHRWDEIVKNIKGINAHKSEKIFAHTSRLIPLDGVYNNPNMLKLFQEYKKFIPYLTIDDSERKKIEIECVKKRNAELEKTHVPKDQIQDMIQEELKKALREAQFQPKSHR